MNVDQYKTKLLARERELTEEVVRNVDDAREAGVAEVGDRADTATAIENQDTSLQEGSLASDGLQAVRDALKRIEDGTYGICVDCGEAIPTARLNAVPWTPYCIADQEKHDAASPNAAAENPASL